MPDESTDETSSDETPPDNRGDEDDERIDERVVVVGSVALFAVPAAMAALLPYIDFPAWALRSSPALAPAAITLYWFLTRPEDDERTDGTGSSEEGTDPELELVSANYKMFSKQAMYRDRLLMRANYFSVAVVGVLVNIFLRTGPQFRPAVAMIGATSAYAFWLATESYKGARDELNEEIRTFEDTWQELSVVETYDTRERSPVGKRSLSSYFVGLQIATTALWVVVYVGYTSYLAYL
ncbi:hypothetical protein [Halobacterium sp. R2-5]|uniref:hypothetical protein n=1 Tax=Halobacterium sp. R2-5 TaxID=2715751 RepID=UPI00141E0E6F|nr:hypothetical protein [Halobacterium sp. R2-5]NIB99267.1 hypothetical protein [Halobacterium sp. R2-5]